VASRSEVFTCLEIQNIPVLSPPRQLGISPIPPPEARPLPAFRLCDQLRSERVAFDIARDGEEMRIGLNRKGFEAALIDRAGAGRVMMGMPALRMRDGDPAQQLGECAITARPQ
jgi:hypothetical protein